MAVLVPARRVVSTPRRLFPRLAVAPAHPLAPGLVAWWQGSQPSFGMIKWIDLLGAHDFTLTNMALAAYGWTPSSRLAGQSEVRFDNGQDFGTTPDTLALRLVNVFSIAFWIYIRDNSGVILSKFSNGAGSGGAALRGIRLQATSMFVTEQSANPLSASTSAHANKWLHVVVVSHPTGSVLYFNGISVSTGAQLTQWFDNAGPLRLGKGEAVFFGSGDGSWGGRCDAVMLYKNRALTAPECQLLFREASQGFPFLLRPQRHRYTVGTQTSQTLVMPAISARAQVPTPLLLTPIRPSAISARAITATPLLGMALPVPAISARAITAQPRIGIVMHPSAISARAQVPTPRITYILQMPAITARALTATPVPTTGVVVRPTNPVLTSSAVTGDWLIQAPHIGLKLSNDFQEADQSWEHRILDISPIEGNVPPGGGIATVGNVTIKIAEDRKGKSLLQLWQQYPAVNGIPITIDLLVSGASAAMAGVSNPLRVFTGKIDTITLQNAMAEILCVDDSLQQNLLLPQTVVTSAAFPNAISAAYGQAEPLIYGAGSNIGAAPLLFVDVPTNTYLVAGHPMYLGSGAIAVWDQANTLFMVASGVTTFTNDTSALVTFGVFSPGPLSWGSGVGVTNGPNVVDGNSQTLTLVNTGTLDSNGLDGFGTLGIFQTVAGTPNTSTMQITLTNHRRSPGSDPTTTGTFYVQTINPSTGGLLRTLYTAGPYNHTTSAQTNVITLSNQQIAFNEQLEVKLIARNQGAVGGASATYEIGEVSMAGIVVYSATSVGLTTMTLPFNTQEIRFNTISYGLLLDTVHTDSFVITPSNAIDLLSTTSAIIPTCALDSNLDGVGTLTVITPATSAQRGNNTLSIDFTKHRRNLSSSPTVTGTFFVQTVNPTTTVILRDNLFVSPPYRQQLNPLSTSFTATAINLGANVQLAVRVLARNEGGFGSFNAGMSIVSTVASTVTFVTQWGTFGSATGQFQFPTYIARETGGNLVVTDQGNNRVQKFTAAGTFLSQLGTSGYGTTEFLGPLGIAVNASQRLFVVDSQNARVQIFDSAGTFLAQFGTYGSGTGQFQLPAGIAADVSGDVWITDATNDNVQVFTSDGGFLFRFGTEGTTPGTMNNPLGIAIDATGTVWVADAGNQRVEAFTSTGTFLRAFGSLGTGNGLFNQPYGIAAGISGTIWVTDATNNTVQRFTSAGSYLLTAGSGGAGNGNFNAPTGIVTDASNTFYVADQNNHRIQQFSVSTTSTVVTVASGANDAYDIAEIGIKSFYQPAGGNMPVFLYGASWFGRYDPDGRYLSYAGQPSGTFFHTPDEVIASILQQEMGRGITTSAFAAAFTWYTNLAFTLDGGIGAGWAVAREQARTVLHEAARQATAILYPNFDNSFKLVPFRSDMPEHLSFSTSNILMVEGAEHDPTAPPQDTMQITLGNLQTVHNAFEVHYAYNAGSRTYGKIMRVDKNGSTLADADQYKTLVERLCLQSYNRHGDLAPLILSAYWIADDKSAQYLLAFLVQYFSGQRTFVEFDTTIMAASLQLGDFVAVTHPLLPDGDTGGLFEVHTIRYLPLTGRMHLLASKVATLSTPAKPRMTARARVPAPIVRQTAALPVAPWSERWEVPSYAAVIQFVDFNELG